MSCPVLPSNGGSAAALKEEDRIYEKVMKFHNEKMKKMNPNMQNIAGGEGSLEQKDIKQSEYDRIKNYTTLEAQFMSKLSVDCSIPKMLYDRCQVNSISELLLLLVLLVPHLWIGNAYVSHILYLCMDDLVKERY